MADKVEKVLQYLIIYCSLPVFKCINTSYLLAYDQWCQRNQFPSRKPYFNFIFFSNSSIIKRNVIVSWYILISKTITKHNRSIFYLELLKKIIGIIFNEEVTFFFLILAQLESSDSVCSCNIAKRYWKWYGVLPCFLYNFFVPFKHIVGRKIQHPGSILNDPSSRLLITISERKCRCFSRTQFL